MRNQLQEKLQHSEKELRLLRLRATAALTTTSTSTAPAAAPIVASTAEEGGGNGGKEGGGVRGGGFSVTASLGHVTASRLRSG